MVFLLSRLLRFLCGFIPVLPMITAYQLIMGKTNGAKEGSAAAPHRIGAYLFCLYLTAVFFVTDIPDLFHFRLETAINLIPFADIQTNTVQYLLNILLFVPLGVLLPLLWREYNGKTAFFLWGLRLSLFIELMQLFNYRATDIDDLLMNVAGTILGYCLFRWARGAFPRLAVFSAGNTRRRSGEPFVCLRFVWISVFFIQPVLASWLRGLLFGERIIIG